MKQHKIAKLIQLSNIQKENLEEIAYEVSEKGGEVAITQLIRDSIQILIDNYRNEIIDRYAPIRLDSAKKE